MSLLDTIERIIRDHDAKARARAADQRPLRDHREVYTGPCINCGETIHGGVNDHWHVDTAAQTCADGDGVAEPDPDGQVLRENGALRCAECGSFVVENLAWTGIGCGLMPWVHGFDWLDDDHTPTPSPDTLPRRL